MQTLCEVIGDSKVTHCFHPLCGKGVFYEDYDFKQWFHKTALQTTGSEKFFLNCKGAYKPSLILFKKQFSIQRAWMGAAFLQVWRAPRRRRRLRRRWCSGSPGWGNWGKAGQVRGRVSAAAVPPACSTVLGKWFSLLDPRLLHNERLRWSYFFGLLKGSNLETRKERVMLCLKNMRKQPAHCWNTTCFREASVVGVICSRAECCHLDVPASGGTGPPAGSLVDGAVVLSALASPAPFSRELAAPQNLSSPHTPARITVRGEPQKEAPHPGTTQACPRAGFWKFAQKFRCNCRQRNGLLMNSWAESSFQNVLASLPVSVKSLHRAHPQVLERAPFKSLAANWNFK